MAASASVVYKVSVHKTVSCSKIGFEFGIVEAVDNSGKIVRSDSQDNITLWVSTHDDGQKTSMFLLRAI